MRRLNDWIVYRRDYLTLVVITFTSLVLIFSNDDDQIHTVRTYAFAGFGYVLDKVSFLQRYNGVYDENSWLRRENARLMLENSQYKEAKYENQRLKALLDFKGGSQLTLAAAKVIGKDEGGFIRSIILDVGEDHHIKKNMAVVTSQGLVGKVFSVGRTTSVVQLMLDRNFRVSSMVQRSRVAGVTKWISGNELALAEVPKRSDVAVGDNVVTSGLSTIFPGGLEIGTIEAVDEAQKGMFTRVRLRPAVDFSKLEEVFVIMVNPETEDQINDYRS